MVNLKYSLHRDDHYKFLSEPASDEELTAAREDARKNIENRKMSMRSCWVCNCAHCHFLEDTTDNFTFVCFVCGHYYHNGIDITEDEE